MPSKEERLVSLLRRWQFINATLGMLAERDRDVLTSMLIGHEGLPEIAKRLKLTKERVRQIYGRAKQTMIDALFLQE